MWEFKYFNYTINDAFLVLKKSTRIPNILNMRQEREVKTWSTEWC